MAGELITLIEHGGDYLVEAVNVVRVGVTVYQVLGRSFNYLRGFIGPKQKENLHKVSEDAFVKLGSIDQDRISDPSPSIVTPLLEAACQESREELQRLWACLLANAMIKNGKVRIDFIDILKQLDPQDALALTVIKDTQNKSDVQAANRQIGEVGLTEDEWLYSWEKLQRLGLAHKMPLPRLDALGRLFLAACSDPT